MTRVLIANTKTVFIQTFTQFYSRKNIDFIHKKKKKRLSRMQIGRI